MALNNFFDGRLFFNAQIMSFDDRFTFAVTKNTVGITANRNIEVQRIAEFICKNRFRILADTKQFIDTETAGDRDILDRQVPAIRKFFWRSAEYWMARFAFPDAARAPNRDYRFRAKYVLREIFEATSIIEFGLDGLLPYVTGPGNEI